MIMKKTLIMSLTLLALTVACGESKPEVIKVDKITPSETIFTYNSLSKAGFKKNKTYNVQDLPKADSAYFGWKEVGTEGLKDFEIRIYEPESAKVRVDNFT